MPGLRVELDGLGARRREVLLGGEDLGVELGPEQVVGNLDLVASLEERDLLVDTLDARLSILSSAGELGGHGLPLG